MRMFLATAFLILGLQSVQAQDYLFRTDSVLRFTLTADFSDLFDNRYDEKYSVEGSVTVKNTHVKDAPVKIGVRGNFRRDEENCSFPPIYLKNKSNSDEVDQIKKIKLVTHCQDDPYFQQYVLREYLAYRIYNQLTDMSLRVRLCEITYQEGEKILLSRYGFLIEETKKFAKRMGIKKLKDPVIGESIPDYRNTGLVSFFEMMIGNTDWYIPDHNIRVYTDRVKNDTLIVPYDFDLSGLVNKPGAKPRVGLKIKSVQERHYLGHCRTPEKYQELISLFNAKKESIYSEVDQILDMNDKNKIEVISYLNSFYDLINNENSFNKAMETCDSYF